MTWCKVCGRDKREGTECTHCMRVKGSHEGKVYPKPGGFIVWDSWRKFYGQHGIEDGNDPLT